MSLNRSFCSQQQMCWLPRRHAIFAESCQRSLRAMALGLLRLREQTTKIEIHDVEGHQLRERVDAEAEKLAYVDPCVIEQALESLKREDWW